MSALPLGPDDVPAPPGAVGWTARDGFLSDGASMDAARADGGVVLPVERGAVRDVTGDAPLAAVVRLDARLDTLTADVGSLRSRLLDVFETAVDLLARAAGACTRSGSPR